MTVIAGAGVLFATAIIILVLNAYLRGWRMVRVWYRAAAFGLAAGDATKFFYSRLREYSSQADERTIN